MIFRIDRMPRILYTDKAPSVIRKSNGGTLKDGNIAQLGEHLPYKQGVIGSIPIVPTIMAR